jgi:hypothetical protein
MSTQAATRRGGAQAIKSSSSKIARALLPAKTTAQLQADRPYVSSIHIGISPTLTSPQTRSTAISLWPPPRSLQPHKHLLPPSSHRQPDRTYRVHIKPEPRRQNSSRECAVRHCLGKEATVPEGQDDVCYANKRTACAYWDDRQGFEEQILASYVQGQ